jgi:type I restriction-modification system DNA methylase subunit
MDKEEAKEKVKEVIEKFEKLNSEGKLKNLNEPNTKNWFIEPLFEALGWGMRSEEISMEEKVSKGRADYAFRLNGVLKFFVEAKALKEDLNELKYASQTIEYGWNKGITWAVLTDFQGLKVFNCEWNEKNLWRNVLFDLNYKQFLEEFDKLWLLSKESFQNDEIGKYADKIGKRIPRRKISDYLLSEFIDWRAKLLNSLKKDYPKYSEEERDEIVQTFLDRLIFIRNCEDRGFEEKKLDGSLREFIFKNKNLNKSLKEIFRYYDENYNSKIFELREVDKVEFSEHLLRNILERVYKTQDENIAYDFSLIDADILGNLYEQYLSHISKKSEEKNKAKRKEQGIYYTPTYIVDYIVKNSVGEYLKNKSIDEILDTKILDPACGSGSFLIRAFSEVCRMIEDKLKMGEKIEKSFNFQNYGGRLTLQQKATILVSCIYGVDLDKKAVEIAQLNLLLKLLEGETAESLSKLNHTKKLLPMLRNIQNGNSLIDDENIDKRAFKWNERFKEVMDEGGFDVVIGNPPYVKSRDTKDPVLRGYMESSGRFETLYKMWDLYVAFVERGIKLLEPNGCFAMIIPDTIGEADYTKKLVEMIITKYSLYQIDFFPEIEVFQGVGVRNKIIFVRNIKNINRCKRVLHEKTLDNIKELDPLSNRSSEVFKLTHSMMDFDFEKTIPLDRICYVSYGARFNSDKNDKIKFKKEDLISDKRDAIHNKLYTEGKFISRYKINKNLYVEWGTERCPKRLVRPTFPELYPPKKILMSRIKRIATYSDEGHTCDNTIIVAVPYCELQGVNNKGISKYIKNIKLKRENIEQISEKFDIKYILSIINSKLIRYFLDINSRSKLSIYPDDWKKIPIKDLTLNQQQPLIALADKMLSLNKRLNELGDKKTEERARIEEEIKKTDYEIDQEVYKLYGLTPEEIKIIEESVK